MLELGESAFAYCENLAAAVIDNSTVENEDYAFYESGDNAFSYCEDLISVEFKGSSLKVGEYAFYDCSAEPVITYQGNNYNNESIENADEKCR